MGPHHSSLMVDEELEMFSSWENIFYTCNNFYNTSTVMGTHKLYSALAALNSMIVITSSWTICIWLFFNTLFTPKNTIWEADVFTEQWVSVQIPYSILFLFHAGKDVTTVPFQGACEILWRFSSEMQKDRIIIAEWLQSRVKRIYTVLGKLISMFAPWLLNTLTFKFKARDQTGRWRHGD